MRTDAIAQDPQETELAERLHAEETKGDQQSSDAPPCGKGLKVEGIPGHFSVTLVFSTDYVFRGLSFSERNPSGQGFLNWSHDSGTYAGVFASNAKFAESVSVEVDFFAGYVAQLGDWVLDFAANYYTFPGAQEFDSPEFWFTSGYNFGFMSVTGHVAYTWDYFGFENALYGSGKVAVPLPAPLPTGFTIDAHVGHQYIEAADIVGLPSYTDWSVGVGYSLWGFDLDLRYVSTDIKRRECSFGDICGAIPLFTISRTF